MFIFRKFKFYLIKKLKNRLFQNFILIAVISVNYLKIHIFFKLKSCSLAFQQHSQASLPPATYYQSFFLVLRRLNLLTRLYAGFSKC